ncbi:MAG: MATE family efflux transporter [Clostridiales bacterium]|nr:MATE family efflux transporter [Clostridiales bacterium]
MEQEQLQQNKMAVTPISKLIWKMGLPMIVSMVLQAVYNIVDTAFVINMSENGTEGNLALTYAFPIQLLIIAIGVGTGVGINVLLSKNLGEGNREKASRVAGNGIFLGICIYVVFLLFGIFGSRWFIAMQANGNETVVEMGTTYLTICCCLSFGAVGFTVYERFLQAAGKTGYSTIAQITGAVLNIVLDYVFIFPCGMGIAGAAWATVIGQIASLITAMLFHYIANREVDGSLRHIKPSGHLIRGIYSVGITAAIMQGLLSVMMLGMNLILGTAGADAELLQGSFGIYYKIQQFALFAAFGLSNTLISVIAFNYGMRSKKRIRQGILWGIVDSVIVAAVITLLFQCFAGPLAALFSMTDGGSTAVREVCVTSIHIASVGYIFMAFSVAVQGILQAFGQAVKPLLLSFFRLVLFVFPVAYLFTLSQDALSLVWWTFPIAEVLTAVIAVFFLLSAHKKQVAPMDSASEMKETV